MKRDIAFLPPVQNKLMKPEQAQHFLHVHDYVGNRHTVLYNAMGPDVVTPLLIANPQQVIGIDIEPFFSAQVRHDHGIDVELVKQERYEHGYWNEDKIKRFGIGSLMSKELEAMAVAKNEVVLLEGGIFFPWKHPDDNAPKDRTLMYRKPEDTIAYSIDLILQKSLPDISQSSGYLTKMYRQNLRGGAFLLVGFPLDKEDTLVSDIKAQIGKEAGYFCAPNVYASGLVAWKKE